MVRARVTALVAVGTVLLAACGHGGTTVKEPKTPAPTSTAPSSAACPNPHGGACLGDLAPGRHETSQFTPQVSYKVPAGWRNDEDLPGNFLLHRTSDPQTGVIGGSYVGIYQGVRAAARSCAEAAQPGVGSTPGELMNWYRSVPGLAMTQPTPVTLGGLNGLMSDFSLKPGARTCTFDGVKAIPLVIGGGVSSLHHVIAHENHVRLIVLGWRSSNVTVEITNLDKQASPDDYRFAVLPILASLKFSQRG